MNTFNILIILFIIIYLTQKIYLEILNNNIFKIIILLSLVVCNNNITSVLITFLYILIIRDNHETFSNCLCNLINNQGYTNKKITCPSDQEIINIRGLAPFCGDPKKHLG